MLTSGQGRGPGRGVVAEQVDVEFARPLFAPLRASLLIWPIIHPNETPSNPFRFG
jgi:hypothetical protein